jgi:uncharacterized membrane protein YphA (DoxX/SURF4 family)
MTRAKKIIYWIATIWLALGMGATGIQQILHMQVEGAISPPGVEGILHLGYPVYVLTIIGFWKILGVIAVLIPKFPLLKEWTYAGFFFLLTGAAYSHIVVNDPAKELIPSLLLLVLTVVSWYLRAVSKKTTSVGQ